MLKKLNKILILESLDKNLQKTNKYKV